jgi:hypothetical protein
MSGQGLLRRSRGAILLKPYLAAELQEPSSAPWASSKIHARTTRKMVGSYKQVKHALGWSDYQVRSDPAIRRHWQLACCAFSFCWWAYGRLPTGDEPTEQQPEGELPAGSSGRGKKDTPGALDGGFEGGKGVAGTVGDAVALLGGVLRSAPATGAKSAA